MSDRPLQKISSPQIRSIGNTRPFSEGNMNAPWAPPPINTLADTGLNLLSVADLVLKVLYFGGYMAGHQIADIIKLPFTGVVDTVMDFLKREKFVEVRGSGGLGEAGYQYLISQKGAEESPRGTGTLAVCGRCTSHAATVHHFDARAEPRKADRPRRRHEGPDAAPRRL